jgi:hypothetical protein
LGVTPAPAEITRSPALNRAIELNPHESRTQEQVATTRAKGQLINSAMQDGGLPKLKEVLDGQIAEQKITPSQAKATLKRAGEQPLVRATDRLPASGTLEVYKLANDTEKTPEFNAAVAGKVANEMTKGELDKAHALYQQAKDAGVPPDQLRSSYGSKLAYAASGPVPRRKLGEAPAAFADRQQSHAAVTKAVQAKLDELAPTDDEKKQWLSDEAKRRNLSSKATGMRLSRLD